MKHLISLTAIISLMIACSCFAAESRLSGIDKDDLIKQLRNLKECKTDDSYAASIDVPLKSGTRFTMGLISLYDEIEPTLFKTLADRPDLTDTLGTENFIIHYDITGFNSVPTLDINPINGIPDYVDSVALICEYVWHFETDTLGFIEPISDGSAGGDDRYDIYLVNIGGQGYYGITYPEIIQPGNRTWSSYIKIDNDYAEFGDLGYNTEPMKAVKVTVAHEFFHSIHFSLDAYEAEGERNWWYEVSAVWMEDVVFDDVNDYRYYLKYFFHYPWYTLESFSYSAADPVRYMHPYAACIWGRFLEERFDRDVMRKIWVQCGVVPGYNVLDATDQILAHDYGSSLEEAFQEFTVWNYFTCDRADTVNKYSEADQWINPLGDEPVPDTIRHRFYTDADPFSYSNDGTPFNMSYTSEDYTPETWSANYIAFETKGGEGSIYKGGLLFGFDGDDILEAGDKWHVNLLGWDTVQDTLIQINLNQSTWQGTDSFNDWGRFDYIVAIPSITGYTYSDASTGYSFTAEYDTVLTAGSPCLYNLPSEVEIKAGVCEDIILYAFDPDEDSVYFETEPSPNSLAGLTLTMTSDSSAVLRFCPGYELLDSVISVIVYAYDDTGHSGHYDIEQINFPIVYYAPLADEKDKPIVNASPNPFSYERDNTMQFRLYMPDSIMADDVEFYVFNTAGDLVYNTVYLNSDGDDWLTPGDAVMRWNVRNNSGNQLASGIYIAQLRAGGKSASGKFAILR